MCKVEIVLREMNIMKNLIFFIFKIANRYKRDDIGTVAASLTYYFIFSIFPFIIFLSHLLGLSNISQTDFFNAIYGVLPVDVIEIIKKYLKHTAENGNTNMLMISLFFSVYFPIRAVSRAMDGINTAYRIESKRSIFRKIVLMIILTILFTGCIVLLFFILFTSNAALSFVSRVLPISLKFIEIWSNTRFFLLGMASFVVLELVYWLVPEKELFFFEALPGAIFSTVGWLIFSIGFSFYVEHMSKYSILYGSIGAIIVLLIWLYFISWILLLGAEINCLISDTKKSKEKLT